MAIRPKAVLLPVGQGPRSLAWHSRPCSLVPVGFLINVSLCTSSSDLCGGQTGLLSISVLQCLTEQIIHAVLTSSSFAVHVLPAFQGWAPVPSPGHLSLSTSPTACAPPVSAGGIALTAWQGHGVAGIGPWGHASRCPASCRQP